MEEILDANGRRFIVWDTVKFYDDEQRNKISELLKSENMIFLQRPNDNKFYLVDEIEDAIIVEELSKKSTELPEQISNQ